MAILNRDTFKSKVSDFINRVSPFTEPLIQKSEDLEIREDAADSVIFKESTISSISSIGSDITIDFTNNDEYNLSSQASAQTDFLITLENLKNNSIGKINITKKSTDIFTFTNAIILNFDGGSSGQAGKDQISFFIIKNDLGHFLIPSFVFKIQTVMLENGSITNDKLATNSVSLSRMQNNSVGNSQIINTAVSLEKVVKEEVDTFRGSAVGVASMNQLSYNGSWYVDNTIPDGPPAPSWDQGILETRAFGAKVFQKVTDYNRGNGRIFLRAITTSGPFSDWVLYQ